MVRFFLSKRLVHGSQWPLGLPRLWLIVNGFLILKDLGGSLYQRFFIPWCTTRSSPKNTCKDKSLILDSEKLSGYQGHDVALWLWVNQDKICVHCPLLSKPLLLSALHFPRRYIHLMLSVETMSDLFNHYRIPLTQSNPLVSLWFSSIGIRLGSGLTSKPM